MDVELFSLSALLQSGFTKSSLRKACARFSCKRDADISLFLKALSLRTEETGASRTYLVLSKKSLDEGRLEIVAFLTLALAVADFSQVDDLEKAAVLGKVPGVATRSAFPGYLIAQLARSDEFSHDDFDASMLLPFAENQFCECIRRIGGSIEYVDCREELLGYYEQQGFSELYFDEKTQLFKLFKDLREIA